MELKDQDSCVMEHRVSSSNWMDILPALITALF